MLSCALFHCWEGSCAVCSLNLHNLLVFCWKAKSVQGRFGNKPAFVRGVQFPDTKATLGNVVYSKLSPRKQAVAAKCPYTNVSDITRDLSCCSGEIAILHWPSSLVQHCLVFWKCTQLLLLFCFLYFLYLLFPPALLLKINIWIIHGVCR